MNGICGAVKMQAEIVAPSGGNAALITLDASTIKLAFAASDVLTDSGNYTVTVQAGYGAAPIISSASLIYTYVNPCLTGLPAD